ncbi:MAG: cation transporter dimerization domain-containing protein [Terracidiphilus sp.]
MRFRTTGYRQIIEAHLLIPHTMKLGQAHRRATRLEECLTIDLEVPSKVTTHLESLQDHSEVYRVQHYRVRTNTRGVRALGSPQTILQSVRKVTAKVQPRSVRSKERSPPKLFINARET